MESHDPSHWRDHGVRVVHGDELDVNTAQTPGILKGLDDAWRRGDKDPDVRVIVFTTTDKTFFGRL